MESGELIKQLQDAGWQIREGKKNHGGSHITLCKSGIRKIITLPHPRKELSKGMLWQAQQISEINLI
ncbi:TPA: type II toxin-antitoxin system HicA family toxin [Yersinia enterocolitica]|uniref:type II toxin-antitoxin system HicA family toxin n=1 Tax=Yersinia enterocolitica TaxID=630 RepID=UPI00094BC046|nr:type II toxin-antitoxin system HicA family toxin [Yersinia enterocolitica]MBW5834585.1 type II toxin-antitoxin system HicA family toxin [Yersinia enterocolitica]HDL8055771.1 type II toxin-antitoxin system HicA family toxin [Yersinia enterocolitica]HEI6852142.1 type II toxin-antitoxin system HicA family toxin [Yersinia enterocolitica]HEN3599938.1 type II toxin-antitoxin system HicA family toxin [Yersinia enterocolitica]HEN3605409.1 type II toxin-antitoxin system HicA family toxin [Yersinia e